MASAPKSNLPMCYNDLMPLNTQEHTKWNARQVDKALWIANQHVVPLTVEEFPMAQRDFPIVFSSGDNPVPLAVMGLNEGVNTFFEKDGTLIGTPYIPAYIRRYPFMLVKMRQDDDNLSLCFDPTSGLLGEFEDGSPCSMPTTRPPRTPRNCSISARSSRKPACAPRRSWTS